MHTKRSTHGIDVATGSRAWLPAGCQVRYCYAGADQDGLDEHAVCRTSNGLLVAVPVENLTDDDGKPFALPSRVGIIPQADSPLA